MKITVIVEMEIPENEMGITYALNEGFKSSMEDRLVGELVKVKSGPYENLAVGTIIGITTETSAHA